MRKPKTAVAAMMDGARQDFDAGQDSRFVRRRTGIPSDGGSADWHERSEPQRLKRIEYARDMCRNHPVIGQGIDRAAENTIQGGFDLDINTGDGTLDDDLLGRWEEWGNDSRQCDIAQENSFADFEELLISQTFGDGDILAHGTDAGSLQIFEAHRNRNPKGRNNDAIGNIVLGVELGQYREKIAFWISDEDLNPLRYTTKSDKFSRLPTYDDAGVRRMFHIHRAKRATQTRGVTALAPVYHIATMSEDTEFAAAFKAQLSACFVLLEEALGAFTPPGPETVTGDRVQEQRPDGGMKTIDGINPGLKYTADTGKKLTGFSPQVMGPDFRVHMKWLLQEISINLGLPLCMLLMDPSEGNFSSQRQAIDMARLGFRQNQRRFSRRFHTPVFLWQVGRWMAADSALKRAVEALQTQRPRGTVADKSPLWVPHEWGFPAWPYIEPLKDRQANAFNVANCMQSARDVDSSTNRRFFKKVDRIIEERVTAIRAAKTAAQALNAEFPDDKQPVRWDQLFCFPSPDGIRTSFAGSADETPEPGPAPGLPAGDAK